MKKILTAICISIASHLLNAQVNVTYRVDITNLLSGANIAPNGMRVGGNFGDLGTSLAQWNPTDPSCAMTNLGNNIWSITVTYPSSSIGQIQSFKFVNGNWGNNEGMNPNNTLVTGGCGTNDGSGNINRNFTIPASNIILTYCYDQCLQCNGSSATAPSNCGSNITISPSNNQAQTGSNVNFTATTSNPSPVYQWQTNPANAGWFNIQNNSTYISSAGNLAVNNLQVYNHQQKFRVISSSGNCVDTSNIAIINIIDTCILTVIDTNHINVYDTTYINVNDTTFITVNDTNTVTIIDTNYISVTDTLIINSVITGVNPPNNQNTIKVFPNPASTHINIDYGNFAIMSGYQLKITNSLGQQVFNTNIIQQSDYLDLSTWSGNGVYFVNIIDPQGNTIDIRKIVIQ